MENFRRFMISQLNLPIEFNDTDTLFAKPELKQTKD